MLNPVDIAIDWEVFSNHRAHLGVHFVRIFDYFQQDGLRSVASLEQAIQMGDAVRMVEPAQRLTEDARLFGAQALALSAERIEITARECVEWQVSPCELVEDIGRLRHLFDETIKALIAASDPVRRRA